MGGGEAKKEAGFERRWEGNERGKLVTRWRENGARRKVEGFLWDGEWETFLVIQHGAPT